MHLRFSSHATKRMHERGISPATVRAVAMHGEEVVQEHGTVRRVLMGYEVVMDADKVVTVFERRSA